MALDVAMVKAVFDEMQAEINRLNFDLVLERQQSKRLLVERNTLHAELSRARSISANLEALGLVGRQRERVGQLEEQLATVTDERDEAWARLDTVEREHAELSERAKDFQGRVDQRDETIASLLDEQARLRRRIAELVEDDDDGSDEVPPSERRSVMVAQAAYARACKHDISKRHKLAALREAKRDMGELPDHLQDDLDDLERDEERGEDLDERAW